MKRSAIRGTAVSYSFIHRLLSRKSYPPPIQIVVGRTYRKSDLRRSRDHIGRYSESLLASVTVQPVQTESPEATYIDDIRSGDMPLAYLKFRSYPHHLDLAQPRNAETVGAAARALPQRALEINGVDRIPALRPNGDLVFEFV